VPPGVVEDLRVFVKDLLLDPIVVVFHTLTPSRSRYQPMPKHDSPPQLQEGHSSDGPAFRLERERLPTTA